MKETLFRAWWVERDNLAYHALRDLLLEEGREIPVCPPEEIELIDIPEPDVSVRWIRWPLFSNRFTLYRVTWLIEDVGGFPTPTTMEYSIDWENPRSMEGLTQVINSLCAMVT